MKYSKTRAVQQIAAAALKSRKLAVGTELVAVSVDERTLEDGTPNDVLLCESASGNIRVPMRELLKMKTAEGKNIFAIEEGSSEVDLPGKVKIVGAEDRKDRNGKTIYPIFAYNLAASQLEAGSIDCEKLVAGGLKDNHGMDPVQNYTVAVL
jgi:hypothetical protein